MDTLVIYEREHLFNADINQLVRYDKGDYIVTEIHKTQHNTRVVLKGDKGITREINIPVCYY